MKELIEISKIIVEIDLLNEESERVQKETKRLFNLQVNHKK